MNIPHLGEILAVSTSICWAFAVIFFRISGFKISPIALNLFKNSVAILLLFPTMYFFGVHLFGTACMADFLILSISGILGLAIADSLFFFSLNILGASLSAIVDCLYVPFVVLFAHLILGERIFFWDYVGAILIIGAVFMTSTSSAKNALERAEIFKGIAFGASSMAITALGIIIAKPIIERTPVLWSTSVRLLAGNFALAAFTLLRKDRKKIWSVFMPQKAWKFSLPAGLIGAYFSMILWIAAMKMIQASIAGILNQLSTIFIVIMAFLFLKERLTVKKIVAVLLAFAGALLVVLA